MIRYDMKSSSIPLNACAPKTCAIPTVPTNPCLQSLKSGSGGGEGTSVSGAAVVIFLGTKTQSCLKVLVFYLVVSTIFYFHPYLGKISNLTNIFQMG